MTNTSADTISPTPWKTRRVIVLGAIVAVLTAVGFSIITPLVNETPGDQEVYSRAARQYVQGEQFYLHDGRAFSYPPFCVLYFAPLAGLTETPLRMAWYLVNFGLLAVVAWHAWTFGRAMKSECRRDHVPHDAWVGGVALLLGARFLISPIEYQGHDQIIGALVILAIVAWSRQRDAAAGAWAGLAAATKATPGLFLPVFLWNRRWRAAAVLAAVGVGATLLPDLFVSNPDAPLWANTWYDTYVAGIDVGSAPEAPWAWVEWNMLNQSLVGTVHRLGTTLPFENELQFDVSLVSLSPAAVKRVAFVAQLAVLALLAYATWPSHVRGVSDRERSVLRIGQGSAVLCAMLLLSPMTSKAHFCVIYVAIAYLVADVFYRRRDPFVIAALAAAFLLGPCSAKDLIGRWWGNRLLAYGALTGLAIVVLAAVTRVIVSRSAEARAALADDAGETQTVSIADPALPKAA